MNSGGDIRNAAPISRSRTRVNRRFEFNVTICDLPDLHLSARPTEDVYVWCWEWGYKSSRFNMHSLHRPSSSPALRPSLLSNQLAMSAVTIHNSDYDLFDAWLHKICMPSILLVSPRLAHWSALDETTQQDNWFMPTEDIISTGVCLRVDEGYFRVFPYENPALVPFEAAVRRLNPVVAVKLRSAAVTAAIRKMSVVFLALESHPLMLLLVAPSMIAFTLTETHVSRSLRP